ncbi:MAG: hypothetical protein AAB562_01495 [Patescibacteria group bacterium]
MYCGRRFQSERRSANKQQRLWHEYVWQKQTLSELAARTGRSARWVRRHIDRTEVQERHGVPQPTVAIADTTFWGENYGVTVFRSPTLKKNLWWTEVKSERVATYYYGRKILEEQGWTFTAAVVDGRRGLARVFQDLPVQICIFHQVKTVTRYLTRRPQTLAGQELRATALRLKDSDEKEFAALLTDWYTRWKSFIDEKTRVIGCNRWFYTHKNVRSAYMSLKNNLPYLFTYQKYLELNIPSTTNSLDGMFTQLKARLSVHRGLRRDRRFKVISTILSGQ